MKKKHPTIGRYCVIRTYSAGVHCGVVESVKGRRVAVSDCRRLWQWEGAFTLSAVALYGPKSAKMPDPVPEIYLTEAIEIIPCSMEAERILRGIKSHAS